MEGRGERGSIMILLAAALVLLVMVTGAVLDMGRALAIQNQMRNAAQASALAGALAYYQSLSPTNLAGVASSAQSGLPEPVGGTDSPADGGNPPSQCMTLPLAGGSGAEQAALSTFAANYPPGKTPPAASAEAGLIGPPCGSSGIGVVVSTQTVVPFYLLPVIGLRSQPIHVTASAVIRQVTGIQQGLFPAGIPLSQMTGAGGSASYPVVALDVPNGKGNGDGMGLSISVGSLDVNISLGDSSSNFNLLNYGGQGGSIGWSQSAICVTGSICANGQPAQPVNVAPGMKIGDLTNLLAQKMSLNQSWNSQGSVGAVTPLNIGQIDPSRVILLPVVTYGSGQGSNQSVTINGFAALYVEWVNSNASSGPVIAGQVIPWSPLVNQVSNVSSTFSGSNFLGFVQQNSVS